MRLHNTYSKGVEEFAPLDGRCVRMYHCGPTVYNSPHIGNFRAFLFADLLRRAFEWMGFEVRQVMNLTDVGHMTHDATDGGQDRMLAAAQREGKDPWAVAEKYIAEFFEVVDLLRMRRAHVYPRATGHIPEMIAMIEALLARGHAYRVGSNVYFDISSFADYGRLSGNPLDELRAGARVEVNPEKRDPLDFALWKSDPHHLMQWDSPWGRGFPGWHIECSAMSVKYLGEPFDVHTGGEDNLFPHHESEIAQSVGVSGRPPVRMWLHVRHLRVEGRKMAKSAGNFVTVRQLVEQGHAATVIRYTLLRVHHRAPMNFTEDLLEDSKAAVRRLNETRGRLAAAGAPGTPSETARERIERFRREHRAALEDDLNVSAALAALHGFATDANRALDRGAPGPDAAAYAAAVGDADSIWGVLDEAPAAMLDAEIERRIREREEARRRKDFAAADRIRQELRAKGILLDDTPHGTRWKREAR